MRRKTYAPKESVQMTRKIKLAQVEMCGEELSTQRCMEDVGHRHSSKALCVLPKPTNKVHLS